MVELSNISLGFEMFEKIAEGIKVKYCQTRLSVGLCWMTDGLKAVMNIFSVSVKNITQVVKAHQRTMLHNTCYIEHMEKQMCMKSLMGERP